MVISSGLLALSGENLASYTRRHLSPHHRRLEDAVNVVAHTTHLRVRVLGIVARRLGSRVPGGVGGGLSLVFMPSDSRDLRCT